jgi:TRAP-type C4-dicarboxylate transport system substrate-binding protein
MRRRSTGCSFVLMRTLLWAALPLVASLSLAGCSGAMDKAGGKPKPAPRKATVLSLAVATDPWEVNAFAEPVSRLSRGTLRIVVKPRWRYGQARYERGLIGDVRAGRVDLGAAESSAWDSVGVSSFHALGAPLLIDSYALQAQVLESSMIPEMLRGLRPLGLVGIGVLPGQLPRPLGVSRPLLSPSDFAGARIRVQQSLIGDETLRVLGARPRWIAGGAPIAGLDGIAEPISWIEGGHDDRVARYLTTNVVLWARPIVLFANKAVFAKLTASHRRALEQAASDAVTGQTNGDLEFERADAGVLCADRRLRFPVARPADLALLRRAVRPLYQQLEKDPRTRRFIAQIETMRARLRASQSVVPSCGAGVSVSSPGVATPLDGVYAVTITPRDLRSPQQLPEEYGSWQIVLDRGRFRLTERSDQADWFAQGVVRVSGDEMTWTVAGADGNRAPDGVPLRGGERLRFRWRRQGNALSLVSEAKPVLAALVARPLVRVGDAPGQQPLENPAAIQGTWVTNVSGADIIAHGGHKADIRDSTGPLRLTVRGNDCRWTQHARDGDHSGVGICRFAGDTFEFDTTPVSSASLPMFFHWSVYHDRLTFRRAPGWFSIWNWTFHPWRKVG